MNRGDRVEVKTAIGPGQWVWKVKGRSITGRIIETDKHCHTVEIDNGDKIRDVKEHFRPAF